MRGSSASVCSAICQALLSERAALGHISEALGESPVVEQMTATLDVLDRAQNDYAAAYGKFCGVAAEVGLTGEALAALRSGECAEG